MIREIKNIFHLLKAILASVYFSFPGKKLAAIGVTGTDGKTTTVNLIYHILTTAGFKTAVLSTLSSAHTTTPDSWKLQKFLAQSVANKCTYVVLEVSSHAIDQNRIWGIPFEIGVLTNVADNEHLDYHKNFENYQKTKLAFLQTCKYKVDLTNLSNLANLKKFEFKTTLVGEFNKQNCLAAIGVAKVLGIDDEIIRKAILSFKFLPGRLEIVSKKPLVIVDFAHTPQAFEYVLPEVKKMGKHLIHVFGCTGDRDKNKRPIMGAISEKFADEIILTTEDTYHENPQDIINQIKTGIKNKNYLEIPDRREAIKRALELAQKDDVIFISGVGHQKSLNIGGKEVPWSDQKTVVELLHELKK